MRCRAAWFSLLLCLPLLGWADYPYYPNSGSGTPSTTPSTPGTATPLDQLINTDTTQGLKLFDQVSYQNMSTDKSDFLQSDDSSDAPKHIKISGSDKAGSL